MGRLSIFASLAANLVKEYGFQTALWIAQRAFLVMLTLGAGPIVLFLGFSWITQYMMNYAGGKIAGSGAEPIVVTLVGVGGWMASELRLPEAFSIYLSFCLLSFMLRLIRVK